MTAPHRISTLIPEYPRRVASIARHGERRLDCRRSPWLHPGDTAGLQLGDDLVGDFGVKARAVVAGASASGVSGHRGSPRRAPEASLPTFNPSRQTRPALSLSTWRGTGKRTAHPHGYLFDRVDARNGDDAAKRGFSAADKPASQGGAEKLRREAQAAERGSRRSVSIAPTREPRRDAGPTAVARPVKKAPAEGQITTPA